MSNEPSIIPSEAEQQELITKFRTSVGLSSDSEARGYLALCDWNLQEALASRAADRRGSDYFDSGSDYFE